MIMRVLFFTNIFLLLSISYYFMFITGTYSMFKNLKKPFEQYTHTFIKISTFKDYIIPNTILGLEIYLI